MSDDTPKWDCEIVVSASIVSNLFLINYDNETIEDVKSYIGKKMRLLERIDLTSNSMYYRQHNIDNYFNGQWGYVDRFMFELTPNSKDDDDNYYGILIAVIEKD